MTIYFAKMGEWIKIGYTAGEASKRIAQLQTGQPQKIELIGTIEGERDAESGLHQEFAEFRGNGEWFKRDAELTTSIAFLVENQHPWYFSRLRAKVDKIWIESFTLKDGVDKSAHDDCAIPPLKDAEKVIKIRILEQRKRKRYSPEWEANLRKSVFSTLKYSGAYLKAWAECALPISNPFGDYSKVIAR